MTKLVQGRKTIHSTLSQSLKIHFLSGFETSPGFKQSNNPTVARKEMGHNQQRLEKLHCVHQRASCIQRKKWDEMKKKEMTRKTKEEQGIHQNKPGKEQGREEKETFREEKGGEGNR